MGRRKFRLAVRKNYERKKALNRVLVVSVPLASYHDGRVSNLKYLRQRITNLNILPVGWLLQDLVDEESSMTFSKSVFHINMKLSIHCNFEWTICINNEEFPFPCYSLPGFKDKMVSSVTEVLQLLKSADDCRICIGNPDSKFFHIRDQRKGQFLNKASK